MALKINILYKLNSAPWGGGNQFLKSLKNYFKKNSVYSQRPEESDVIIFNSHHELFKISWLKFRHPEKAFVHRLDNLMFLIRGHGKEVDRLMLILNDKIADGSIFQSDWCMGRFHEYGIKLLKYTAVIHNAPDPSIFFPLDSKDKIRNGFKVKLIATSWSANPRKGFLIYSYLDEKLDFNKYSMTFVGNSPIKFKNIRQIPPLTSNDLAEVLRKHDIFVSGSLNEACPNSLIEAMHCGLIPVVINSGSHKELVKDQGIVFDDVKEVLGAVENAAVNLDRFKKKLFPKTMNKAGEEYINFCNSVFQNKIRKHLSFYDFIYLTLRIISWRVKDRVRGMGYYQWLTKKNTACVSGSINNNLK